MALLWGKPAIRTNFNNKQWVEGSPDGNGVALRTIARSSETNGQFAKWEQLLRAGTPKDPFPHMHHNFDETNEVIQGRLCYQPIGGPVQLLNVGDKVVAPAGVAHIVWNPDEKEDTRVLLTSSPGAVSSEGALETAVALQHDYGDIPAIPLPQLFLTLVATRGQPGHIPRWLFTILAAILGPLGTLLGFKAVYPEHRGLSEREAAARGIPIAVDPEME